MSEDVKNNEEKVDISADTEDTKDSTKEGRDIYEVSFWIAPIVPEENIDTKLAEIKDFLSKSSAEFISEERPKFMDIAYSIKVFIEENKHDFAKGYFGWIKFELDVDQAREVSDYFKKDEYIIRHLMIKTVRENTMSSKKLYMKEQTNKATIQKKDLKTEATEEVSGEPISEVELDKTIDNLLVD